MGILPFSFCLTSIICHTCNTSIMQEIARIIKNGNSLSVNVTRLCRKLGLDAGDQVLIDISVPDFADKIVPEKSALTEEEAVSVVRSIFEEFGKKGLFLTQVEFYAYESTGTPDAMTKRAVDIMIEAGELTRDSNDRIWYGSKGDDPIRKIFRDRRTRKLNRESIYVDDLGQLERFVRDYDVVGTVPLSRVDFDIYDEIIDHEFAVRTKDDRVFLVSNPYKKEGEERNAIDFAAKHGLEYKYIDDYSWYHKGDTRLVLFWIKDE